MIWRERKTGQGLKAWEEEEREDDDEKEEEEEEEEQKDEKEEEGRRVEEGRGRSFLGRREGRG